MILRRKNENMDRKLKLSTLNPHITCNICKGYLIEATAITECLHTFCKSCLIKRLEADTTCPTCKIVIHHSYPRQYINFDRTMQDIVYKLVPGLQQNEIQRERQFYLKRGLPYPKEVLQESEQETSNNKDEKVSEASDPSSDEIPAKDELISVCLEFQTASATTTTSSSVNQQSPKKVFVRVPTKTTVLTLKRFVAKKLLNDVGAVTNVDIYCNCDLLLDLNENLKFIFLTRWKFDQVPFLLRCETK